MSELAVNFASRIPRFVRLHREDSISIVWVNIDRVATIEIVDGRLELHDVSPPSVLCSPIESVPDTPMNRVSLGIDYR